MLGLPVRLKANISSIFAMGDLDLPEAQLLQPLLPASRHQNGKATGWSAASSSQYYLHEFDLRSYF